MAASIVLLQHTNPHTCPLAIGIGKCRCPLHGVISIIRFVQEGIPVTVRCVAPANILIDYHIAAERSLDTEVGGIFVVLVVGSAFQNDGEFSWRRRPENVGAKYCAIPHFGLDAVFNGYGIGFRSDTELRNEREAHGRNANREFVDNRQSHRRSSTSRIRPKRSGT